MSVRFVYIDIKHVSGYSENRHKVEIAKNSPRTEDQQVEDHLRVKACPKSGYRGSWSWKYSEDKKVAEPKS